MEELEAEKGLEWHPFLRNEKKDITESLVF